MYLRYWAGHEHTGFYPSFISKYTGYLSQVPRIQSGFFFPYSVKWVHCFNMVLSKSEFSFLSLVIACALLVGFSMGSDTWYPFIHTLINESSDYDHFLCSLIQSHSHVGVPWVTCILCAVLFHALWFYYITYDIFTLT